MSLANFLYSKRRKKINKKQLLSAVQARHIIIRVSENKRQDKSLSEVKYEEKRSFWKIFFDFF